MANLDRFHDGRMLNANDPDVLRDTLVERQRSEDRNVFRAAWVWLIRFAFWVLYNPLAWAYDGVSQAVSLGHWRDWQRMALPELRGAQVLELAFGTGNVLLDLHKARYRPVGLDLSSAMTRITRRKLCGHGIAIPLVRGRAQRLPFAPSSFDSVLCTFPTEFIVAPDTLSEIARVLRPAGRAVIVVMTRLLENSLWCRVLEWLYQITGQRGPVPDLEPQLAALGLDYQAMWKAVDGSAVLLAVIERQVDG